MNEAADHLKAIADRFDAYIESMVNHYDANAESVALDAITVTLEREPVHRAAFRNALATEFARAHALAIERRLDIYKDEDLSAYKTIARALGASDQAIREDLGVPSRVLGKKRVRELGLDRDTLLEKLRSWARFNPHVVTDTAHRVGLLARAALDEADSLGEPDSVVRCMELHAKERHNWRG